MQQITIKNVGCLNEQQIMRLITNARKLRIENQILKEELDSIKEVTA